ncbi:MAG TPA: hypothetical protein VLL08_04935 [Kineosporiaceae bacterium]|nr:hypothetical protein [Kineosporiaceae bacterium]
MRKKFAAALAVGTVGLSGLVLAGPALTAVGAPSAAATASAPVDRIKEALSGLVTDKTLTQAQADKVASTLKSAGVGRGGPGGGGFGGHRGGGHDLSTAATALGMTEADLRTALGSGKTLAAVAKEKSVSVDTLISALVKAEKERIAKEVTDKKITQAQADERLADLTKRVTDRVNSTRPTRPGRPDGAGKGFGATPSAAPSATSS